MLKEKRKKNNDAYSKIFGATFGQISFATFVIAAVSGVILAIPYDIAKPYESITLMSVANGPAYFARSIHYWSAQFFLIFFILHIWDHLRLTTEKNVSGSVWFRLTISILFALFLMLSGFILKGDNESLQAFRIFESLFSGIPVIGKSISYFLLGSENNLQIIYVHHIATATIFLWVFIIEHAKSFWPRLGFTLLFSIPIVILAFVFPAKIHDNLATAMKGPWFFLGLQEIFHWISSPMIILILIFIILIGFYIIRKIDKLHAKRIKVTLLILFFVYLTLTIVGYFFRGENWEFTWPWLNPYLSDASIAPIENINSYFSYDSTAVDAPIIIGRHESCLVCHSGIKGFSKSHDSNAIGCYSCHKGNPYSIDKTSAHKGMFLIPGNINNAKETCGSAQCHPEIIDRVNNSIMTTMNGVVSVDKWVFREAESPTFKSHVQSIGFSPAETHLRNLCASCHLGNEKTELGPIGELSRGGGCNACHLNYSQEAINELNEYNKTVREGKKSTWKKFSFHPSIDLNIKNDHCFGCHSRSGRISLSYDGWNETTLTPSDLNEKNNFRILADERVVVQVKKDIHSEKGMICVDCHNSYETMGDGNYYLHKEDQLKVKCVDCHTSNPQITTYAQFESESKKIADLLEMNVPDRSYLKTSQGGYPIINSFVENGKMKLIKKSNREISEIRPPAKVCTEGSAHKNLSCNSCHNSWTPQCIGCHTEFDKNGTMFDLLANKEAQGEWIEHQNEILAEPASLGVRETKNKNGTMIKSVVEFMPGMIMTLDRDKNSSKEKMEFKRLFAPAFSHTIRRESRSCESCHNNPLALGYGRGKFEYRINGKTGRWEFIPKYPAVKYDGLPEDAWIGFLSERDYSSTTRKNTRPFTISEQKKILEVGACLTCHKSNSTVIKNSLLDYEKTKSKISVNCIIPK